MEVRVRRADGGEEWDSMVEKKSLHHASAVKTVYLQVMWIMWLERC
jgi:hypothetical protein